jgi:hypothetical protein
MHEIISLERGLYIRRPANKYTQLGDMIFIHRRASTHYQHTHIFMLKSRQDLYFSQRSLAISLMLEWADFLDRHSHPQTVVHRRAKDKKTSNFYSLPRQRFTPIYSHEICYIFVLFATNCYIANRTYQTMPYAPSPI